MVVSSQPEARPDSIPTRKEGKRTHNNSVVSHCGQNNQISEETLARMSFKETKEVLLLTFHDHNEQDVEGRQWELMRRIKNGRNSFECEQEQRSNYPELHLYPATTHIAISVYGGYMQPIRARLIGLRRSGKVHWKILPRSSNLPQPSKVLQR